jgi:hypothetical protein
MNREEYPLIDDITHTKFNFFSKGPKGVIRKTIEFRDLGDNAFNLCFGDWNESHQKIDDRSRTNNHDRQMVFNTVASAVLKFLKYFPAARIIAKGSTAARTRLYQIIINANLAEIRALLKVYGYQNGEWCRLEKGKSYGAFMVSYNDYLLT